MAPRLRPVPRLLAGRGTGRLAARLVLGAVRGILPRQAGLLDALGHQPLVLRLAPAREQPAFLVPQPGRPLEVLLVDGGLLLSADPSDRRVDAAQPLPRRRLLDAELLLDGAQPRAEDMQLMRDFLQRGALPARTCPRRPAPTSALAYLVAVQQPDDFLPDPSQLDAPAARTAAGRSRRRR